MLLIYLPQSSSRTQYIFDAVLINELGIRYNTTDNIAFFENYTEEKINYSASRVADEFFIKAAPFLTENFIRDFEVPVSEKDQIKVLFPNNEECNVGFDIFSSAFYMLSRYEEYLPFTPDEHGRFKADDSLAYKNSFLQFPIVDKWIELFKSLLQKRFPSLKFKSSKFNAIVTYDIDVAYKFKGRSFKRNAGSTFKDLFKFDFKNIRSRIQTLSNKCKDPWDVYNYLHETITKNNLQSIFFFLLGDNSAHDGNLKYHNPVMKNLINKIKSFSEIGIHPSYYSSIVPGKIAAEKERLENISAQTITKSRQHYLKFTLPDTYNSLLSCGITEDYSMGFAQLPGFRAGTCKPFYFYDLKNEKITALKIYPITCMEATFKYYSKISPAKALVEILNLLKEVKKVNGTFISIWHNDNLEEDKLDKKWYSVHNSMISQIKTYLRK